MKAANGAMTTMVVLENATMDITFTIQTNVLKRSNIALNKKGTFVLNVLSRITGKAGTGNSVLNVIRIVKFVMKTLLIATHVEKVIGLIINQNDVQMNGQVTWFVILLKIVLKCQKNVLLFKENVRD